MNAKEKQYLEIFLSPVRKCKNYKPKFGQGKTGKEFSLTEFKALYGEDPFYSWIGLDSNLMYSAHKAAGGITSIYRQIGIGCERLFRAILIDSAGYTETKFATWSYTTKTRSGKVKKLSLDGRLELSEIKNQRVLDNLKNWITEYCSDLGEVAEPSQGIVFEVRQGYKSKDSKRQHGDIDNATVAWANNYLPVFAIFSSQVDSDLVLRYKNNRCGILIGTRSANKHISLYAFCEEVLEYKLADFFQSCSPKIKREINEILVALLDVKS